MASAACLVCDCDRPVHARRLCTRHYLASWRARKRPLPIPAPAVDLTGYRFSDLTVTAWDERLGRWECRCDCGRSRTVHGWQLRSAQIRTCGHHRVQNGRKRGAESRRRAG